MNATRNRPPPVSNVWKFRRAFFPIIGISAFLATSLSSAALEFHVSPAGSDANAGTKEKPFATIGHARDVVRASPQRTKEAISVVLHGGIYYLPETLVFTAEDSGSAPGRAVEYRSAEGEEAVISGGFEITGLKWEPFRDGIMQAKVSITHEPSAISFDQLFVNGERQPMARYPNFDASIRIFNGFAADAISDARTAKWSDPTGGFIHMMHGAMWGGYHYVITGKDAAGKLTYEGGWQNNRGGPIHKEYRFVENIFEELDAPGEWFFRRESDAGIPARGSDASAGKMPASPSGTLYFYPPVGLDLKTAKFEGVRLRHLVEFRGDEKNPVKHVLLRGLTFRHAARTFMDNKEKLLRTDWTVYRGGAIYFNGAENCHVQDCFLDQVGGNAIFADGYNRSLAIQQCHISKAGGNGVSFVGSQDAVRDGLVGYEKRNNFATVDKTPGPKTQDYPADCLVEDCLIHETGRVEKQTAGVEIDIAMNITVRHCSIYDMPRAGINIGDGCFGGHIVEFCDVFDTVKETGDHGSFNSWGRDRYWGLQGVDLGTVTLGADKGLVTLDVIATNILRNTRWRCDHGWDIDLDDGSTLYEIRNNLCLNGGIKNREGFYRTVENNIMVNNSFHPHVWYGNSQDVFSHNIFFGTHRPVGVKAPWGKEFDYNFLHRAGAAEALATDLQKQTGRDEHSLVGDAIFVDPSTGDYRVKDGSPALKLGFKNFPMDQFGVQFAKLKAIAKTPELPVPGVTKQEESKRDAKTVSWQGAKIKNIIGLGEISAAGLPGEIGVRLVEVPAGSGAAKTGLREGDVILKCNDKTTDSMADFFRVWKTVKESARLDVWRGQKSVTIEFKRDAPKKSAASSAPVTVEARDDQNFLAVAKASANDLAQGRAVVANQHTANEPLAVLTDGKIAENYGPVFSNGAAGGMYKIDLGEPKAIAQINTYSFGMGARGHQKFGLYGSNAADPGWDVYDSGTFTLIAEVDTTKNSQGRFEATSVQASGAKYRWLVWAVEAVNERPGENTAFQEFDVIEAK